MTEPTGFQTPTEDKPLIPRNDADRQAYKNAALVFATATSTVIPLGTYIAMGMQSSLTSYDTAQYGILNFMMAYATSKLTHAYSRAARYENGPESRVLKNLNSHNGELPVIAFAASFTCLAVAGGHALNNIVHGDKAQRIEDLPTIRDYMRDAAVEEFCRDKDNGKTIVVKISGEDFQLTCH